MTSIAILEAVNTSYVPFNGQQIITAVAAGVTYVAMRKIVENIGIDWTGQSVKLRKQREKFGCRDISIPSKGGIQKMLCIPLKKLNGWLFSINPEKVRADIRDKLIQYQEECFTVLHDYWTKGKAESPRKTQQSTARQLTPLRQTAERLIATGMGRIYPDIWKFVHQHFEIEHINQLKPSQISEAVTYLDALEGEFLGKQQAVTSSRYHYPVETADPHNRTFANDWISA
ncbi:phage antirepressor N-terminal domain-containing protein [Klebsiella pneumoniae]|uniref:phage antirepressor N-terminal domain-containing protein n=1 Tax=Klebsiella pneumoniae TaxID=573 RepID=UPI0039706A6A